MLMRGFLASDGIIGDVKKTLLSIAQDGDNFRDALLYLFGNRFAKHSEDYMDQVRAIRSTLSKNRAKRPFYQSNPHRGGTAGKGMEVQGKQGSISRPQELP